MSYDDLPPDAVAPLDAGLVAMNTPFKCLDTVIALYDFPGTQPSHLPLDLGDTVYVLAKNDSGWWDGVVFSRSGDMSRGWFPHTYVRSVNYAQPVLNKLKDNKELDSITAANTAANVLIPLFAVLLQKNLGDLGRDSPASNTRKNSVVSFASLETSIHSESRSRREHKLEPPQLPSQPPPPANHQYSVASTILMPYGSFSQSMSPSESADYSRFVPVEEAENLATAIKKAHGRNVVWLPRLTDSGDLAFYSEELDVYCEALPLVQLDMAVDLDGGNMILPSQEAINDTTIVSHVPAGADFYDSDLIEPASRLGSSVTKSFDIKRDSNASNISQNSASSYHHFMHPFFNVPGLFHAQYLDLTQWTELHEQFNYLLDLTYKALKDSNKQLFTMHLSRLTKLVAIVMFSARLVQDDFVGSKYEKSVRRKLKRLSESFAQMYINGLLHLSVMHYSLASSTADLFSLDIRRLNKSTSSQSTIHQSGSSKGLLGAAFPLTQQKPTEEYLDQALAAMLNSSEEAIVSYLHQIDHDAEIVRDSLNGLMKIFLRLSKNKKVSARDYDSSDMSENEDQDRYNVLPQVYPRFITEEFNGGNWCNPFFAGGHSYLNLSGDQLKNRYHLKAVIDQLAYDQAAKYTAEMTKHSKDINHYLAPDQQDRYYNESLKAERNEQVLRIMYKLLHHASSLVDLLESLDFTVFCLIKRYSSADKSPSLSTDDEKIPPMQHHERLPDESDENIITPGDTSDQVANSNLTFDYPMVLEFFQYKQQLHTWIASIVIHSQSLTLEDPDVFTAMKEDDSVVYNREALKSPLERSSRLLSNIISQQGKRKGVERMSIDLDQHLSELIESGLDVTQVILKTIQLLVEERETILNYATRVMHDDFNVELLVIEKNNTSAGHKSDDGANHYYSGKSKNEDTPWYMEGDEEFDLLFDANRHIKGGTKEALVAHLTHHEEFDASFNTAFLVSFATIMPIGEMIQLLINRFNIEAPEGLSYEEYLSWKSQKQGRIRLKVLNIMKLILENYWSDSYFNKTVLNRWSSFLKQLDVISFQITSRLITDIELILDGEILTEEPETILLGDKPPAPILKGFALRKLKLLDIEYVELARQLTIREFALYSEISKLACINKVWGKKSGLTESIEPITAFIKASNQLTNFVAYMILRKKDSRKRVQVIRYFVHVADKCRQYNNFSSMTAIISALYSSPIHRLKKTWAYVSRDTWAQLQSMNKLMNSSRNFNEYRDMLKFIGSEPCVPFFGVYLSDLTFVYHGNPDYLLNRNRMVNFAKRAKTVDIVTGIDRFKRIGYNFQTVNEIQNYLDLWFDKCPTIEEQYQLSLNLEPREVSDRKQSKALPKTPQQQTHISSLRHRQPMNVLGLR